jgi:hypothetical protein
MRMARQIACLNAVMILAGCAAPTPGDPQGPPWPSDLPARSYFEAAWRADEANAARQPLSDYLRFVCDFYRGSLLAPGWRQAQASLLRAADPRDRVVLEPKATCLGQILSAEWAKDNTVRRVDSARIESLAREVRQAAGGTALQDTLDRLLHEAAVWVAGGIALEAGP